MHHLPIPQCDHFWSVGFLIRFEVACQAIVAQLQDAIICQQQIGQLQVSMENPMTVQVMHDLQQLQGGYSCVIVSSACITVIGQPQGGQRQVSVNSLVAVQVMHDLQQLQ